MFSVTGIVAGAGSVSVTANVTGLAPGTYNGTVTITATGATGSPATIPVTLNIAQPPVLAVAPSSLTFTGAGSQSLAISNTGGGTLNWTAAANQAWLSVAPLSGTGVGSVSVTANVTGLAPGTYNGAVTITATGATGSPATIPVTLNIAQPPVLAVAPSSLTFTGAGSQSFSISNTGGGTLNWTAAANQAWLSVAPLSGTGAGSVSVTANVTGLAPGTYNGAVTITATGATGSPATIPVTLNIAQPPVLAVAPSSLTFTGAGSQSLAISNTGGGTLNWTAAANQAWLSVAPLSGTGAGSVSVTANVTGLAPGTYNGAVTITATSATGSPATIPVTLNIAQPPVLTVAPSSLTFTGAGSQNLSISNTGGGTLNWTAAANQAWLSVAPLSGTGAGSVSVTANVTGLAPGTYNGAVTITATSATGSPATIPVTLNIAQPPVLTVAPSSLTFTGAGSQSLAISNTGGGTLNWTAAANQAWLTVTPLSGTGAGSVSVTANVTGLAPGTYNGAVTITATGATGSPATIPVTLNIAQPPVLTVAPSSLTFTGAGSQSLAISNTGGGTLNWTAAANQAWLTVTPLSGTGAGSVSVTANVTGLAPGTYNGAVTITATGATGSPATIPVTLNIAQPPVLAVAPSSLTFTGAGSQSLAISNTGGGTLNWTAAANQAWLSVSPLSGTGVGSVSVTANVTGLAPGTYNGAVTITATGATGSPATIPVTLNIAQPPVLAVAPSSLTFTGAGSQSFSISNTGGGTLNWTAAANQAWLSVSPLSGTGAGSVSVTANVTGLAPGTYNGTVTITATGATGSPATIPVTLNIDRNRSGRACRAGRGDRDRAVVGAGCKSSHIRRHTDGPRARSRQRCDAQPGLIGSRGPVKRAAASIADRERLRAGARESQRRRRDGKHRRRGKRRDANRIHESTADDPDEINFQQAVGHGHRKLPVNRGAIARSRDDIEVLQYRDAPDEDVEHPIAHLPEANFRKLQSERIGAIGQRNQVTEIGIQSRSPRTVKLDIAGVRDRIASVEQVTARVVIVGSPIDAAREQIRAPRINSDPLGVHHGRHEQAQPSETGQQSTEPCELFACG